jgi:glycosyltransferase involved in cell wall biosynthesis
VEGYPPLAQAAHAHLLAGRLFEARAALARAPELEPSKRHDLRSLEAQLELLAGRWRPPQARLPPGRPRPGRVAHMVSASLPQLQTGYTLRTRHVTAAQSAAGLDPHVLTQWGFPWHDGLPSPAGSERVAGVRHWRLGGGGPAPPLDELLSRNVLDAAELLGRLRPAVLHPASDFVNARLALALRDVLGVPVVYEVRGLWDESWLGAGPRDEADELYRLRRERELECMRAADRVVTLGQAMRAELVGAGVPGQRVVVVPNGAAPDAFNRVERDPALARSLGLGPDEVVIGYVGSLVTYEGLDLLVEAMALLRDRKRRARAVIVGDGARERARLETLAGQLGVLDRVLLAGPVPHCEVPRWHGLLDVFAMPRRDERVCRVVAPLKPLEAMAAGRAVVVPDLPALREVVRDGDTGVTVPAGDAGALARALEELIDAPQRRRALGRAAREWVRAERTWAGAAERYRRLYEELGAAPG